jgi:superfamily I DNA and/or RNA helicase
VNEDADGSEGHWIPGQGERAIKGIKKLIKGKLRNEDGKLRIFVITPFRTVAAKMRDRLAAEFSWADASEMCGTVHTFQGREADYVLFLLGGDPNKPGVVAGFAGKNPNLVNVAVTRAKKRLFVIGNRTFWTGRNDTRGYYEHMAELLDAHLAAMKSSAQGPLPADEGRADSCVAESDG